MNAPASKPIIPKLHSKSILHTTILPSICLAGSICGLVLEFNGGNENITSFMAIIIAGTTFFIEVGKYF